ILEKRPDSAARVAERGQAEDGIHDELSGTVISPAPAAVRAPDGRSRIAWLITGRALGATGSEGRARLSHEERARDRARRRLGRVVLAERLPIIPGDGGPNLDGVTHAPVI